MVGEGCAGHWCDRRGRVIISPEEANDHLQESIPVFPADGSWALLSNTGRSPGDEFRRSDPDTGTRPLAMAARLRVLLLARIQGTGVFARPGSATGARGRAVRIRRRSRRVKGFAGRASLVAPIP